ncbi:MAG: DNA-processing protein DprA [Clostridia bacterium]|nr:DNA-processing protein DprA [Clostridia bacterium]
MDKTLLWVWLSLHMKQGTHVYHYLLEEFGDIEAIYNCEDNDVKDLPWLYDNQKSKILDKTLDRAKEVIRWCERASVKILTLDDDEYPETLRSIDTRPGVLYYIGTLPDFKNDLCIGVVGTREMTTFGERSAFEIGYGLTKGGAIVVSGGALGIDCTAQKGALIAGGATVSILGSGIDVLYPYQNKDFFIKVLEKGAIITEYPPHSPPNGYHFPVRNRLISGISRGLVVVEGDRNSGSMITADKATKQGRMLFSVPGQPGVFQATGTNELIRTGAKAVSCAIDILEEYLEEYSDKIKITPSKEKPDLSLLKKYDEEEKHGFIKNFLDAIGFKPKSSKRKSNQKKIQAEPLDNENAIDSFSTAEKEAIVNECESYLSEDNRQILNKMEIGKRYHTDTLVEMGFETQTVSTSMVLLEMSQFVQSFPGGFYERIK